MRIGNGCCLLRTFLCPARLAAMAAAALLSAACIPDAAAQEHQRPSATLTMRSTVLELLLRDSRTEQQSVAKTLLRSEVTGCQTTLTESRLRIVPNSQPLQFEIHTRGTVSSRTTGVNPQAVVDSLGTHRFLVIKPFWFDGRRFLTRQSHGTIEAFQMPQRVISAAGVRMPLLAPFTDQIAWNRVRRMQPEINQAVAADLSDDVFPQVDRQVELEFVRLEERWQHSQRLLQRLIPQNSLQWSAIARDDSVLLTTGSPPQSIAANAAIARRPDSTTADVTPAAAPRLPLSATQNSEDIVLTLSDSTLTQLACATVPAGMRISDTNLQRLTALLPGLFSGQTADLSKLSAIITDSTAPATFFTLELPASEPISFSCEDGDLRLNLKFRIQPLIGSDSGWLTTTLFLRGKRLDAGKWTLAVRDVAVNAGPAPNADDVATGPASDPADENTETVHTGTVWPALVRARLSTLLKSTTEPALPIEFTLPLADQDPVRLKLHQADSRNGQLRIAFKVLATANPR